MKQTEDNRPKVFRQFPDRRRHLALWQVLLGLGTVLALFLYALLLRPELSGGQFLTLVLGSLLVGAVWFTANKFAGQFFEARERSDEAQSRLAAIVQSCDDAIIGKTLDGIITTWNAGAENMFGYSEQEVVGRSIALLNPPDRPNPDILLMVTQGKGINRYETERIRKDGRRLVVSVSVSPIKNPKGIINGASTIARDITQLKIVEEKLRAHASHLETLFSVAQDVGGTLSLEQVLDRALRRVIGASGFEYAFIRFYDASSQLRSHGACSEPGLPTQELQTFKDISDATVERMPDPNQPWFVENASTTSALGPVYSAAGLKALAVLPFRRSAQLYGTLTLMSAQAHNYTAEHSQFLHALAQQIALAVENASLYGATLQINQHLEAEVEERRRAEKLLADFTALVVHDLRAPLSNLASIAESLRDEVFGTVNLQQKIWLGKIRANCNNLIAHVSEFLDLSKMEAGHIELVKHPVDLARLLSDSVLEHSIIAGKHSIGLELALQSPLPVVSLDSRRIDQVLDNLLSNALKFTQDGGRIEIGAQSVGGNQVKIWVKDTGVGIPQSDIILIFEKYRQVSSSNRSNSLGTGLGLAICTKIVEAHGGAIWVESEEKKGSTFTFSLPVGLADAQQPVENQFLAL